MNPYLSKTLKILLSGVTLALLFGCSGSPEFPASSSRYTIDQDRAPTQERLDISSIPEVVPLPVNRTMAGNRSPYTVLGETYRVMPSEEGYEERGVASWYGEKFHGHQTSNGEIFDMYQASAAHKTLPIPSFLRVTNLENNRSIVVRVNDRGPFHGERLVDLSYAAAAKLGYAERGTTRVHLEAIVPPAFSNEVGSRAAGTEAVTLPAIGRGTKQYVQVGAFSDLEAARRLRGRLQEITSLPVFIQDVVSSSTQRLHRVRVGPILTGEEIQLITERVVAANLGSPYTVSE
ncbi:MAG: septal ring lytic transglycosylase RlpA family protein [Gammaproteobacteria bacterium]|nr:septal ring lytic transglycosylase RlpA family protein [Gammaproteobacteria bacterium]